MIDIHRVLNGYYNSMWKLDEEFHRLADILDEKYPELIGIHHQGPWQSLPALYRDCVDTNERSYLAKDAYISICGAMEKCQAPTF